MININIDENALNLIRQTISKNNNQDVYPRIYMRKGGCAGNMLVLSMQEKQNTDEVFDINDIEFVVSNEVLSNTNDISIILQQGLGAQIIVKNNSASSKCKCGKSFRI